jgi:hypothetical protein
MTTERTYKCIDCPFSTNDPDAARGHFGYVASGHPRGWLGDGVEHRPEPKMLPGQTPYSARELTTLYDLVNDAAEGDPGERGEIESDTRGGHSA